MRPRYCVTWWTLKSASRINDTKKQLATDLIATDLRGFTRIHADRFTPI